MKFRHYKGAHTLGNLYIIGFNVYFNEHYRELTIDLILGKHVFVTRIGNTK